VIAPVRRLLGSLALAGKLSGSLNFVG